MKPPVVRYKVRPDWVSSDACLRPRPTDRLNPPPRPPPYPQIYNPSAKEGGVWLSLDQCSAENTRVASQFVSTVATGAARAMASEQQTGQVRWWVCVCMRGGMWIGLRRHLIVWKPTHTRIYIYIYMHKYSESVRHVERPGPVPVSGFVCCTGEKIGADVWVRDA